MAEEITIIEMDDGMAEELIWELLSNACTDLYFEDIQDVLSIEMDQIVRVVNKLYAQGDIELND